MMESKLPRYIKIYQEIKSDILSGKYPIDSFLPTETELENIYSASRTTIRSAVAALREDRLVEVRQGRGTKVVGAQKISGEYSFPSVKSSTTVTNQFLFDGDYTTGSQGAAIDHIHASSEIATALGLKPEAEVYRLQRNKFVNNTIFCYTASYIPCSLTPGLEDYNGSIIFLYQFLKETYRIDYLSSRINISAVTAGFLEARLLNVRTGSPLLKNVRVAYSKDGPFEYNESLFCPDIMQIVVDLKAQPPEPLD